MTGATLALVAGNATAQTLSFDIAAQPASSGVPAFGRQADLQILLDQSVAAGRRVNAVRGRFSAREGLARLLVGTGLSVRADYGHTILLAATPAPRPQPAPPILAPAAPEPDVAVEAVIVAGYRASLASAMAIKRRAAGVVEAIVSEDVGDFPDANLAESLQRLSGVSIERDAGEGRTLSVRGLAGDFVRVRLNGLETLATSGGTGAATNSANRSRGFDFNTFASELFSTLTVRKTASAEIEEGGLGATIDLQTPRPLDTPGLHATVASQAAFYELGDHRAYPRVSALMSNTFAQDRLGVLVSAAYSRRRSLEDSYNSTGDYIASFNGGFCPPTGGACPGPDGANQRSTAEAYGVITAGSPVTYMPLVPRYGRYSHDQQRLGVSATLQARPREGTLLTLDYFASRYDEQRLDRNIEILSLNRDNRGAADPRFVGRPAMAVTAAQVSPQGELVYARFDNTDIRTEVFADDFVTRFDQLSLKLDQTLSSRLKASVLLGRSRSRFSDPNQRLVGYDAFDQDGVVFDARATGNVPILRFGTGLDPASAGAWSFADGYSEIRRFSNFIDNRYDAAQADLVFDARSGVTIKGGVSLRRYGFDQTRDQRSAPFTSVPAVGDLRDLSVLVERWGASLPRAPEGISAWLSPDIDAFERRFGLNCNCVNAWGDWRMAASGNSRLENRGVTEDDLGGYLQADLVAQVGAVPVRLVAGLRYAATRQHAYGLTSTGEWQHDRRRYDNLLPSATLVSDVTPNTRLRLSLARTMARPALSALTPAGVLTSDSSGLKYLTGNPSVSPYMATNLDLSVDHHLGREGLISASVFHLTIDNFPQALSRLGALSDTGLPNPAIPAGASALTPVAITQVVNTKGGWLRGLEIGFQKPLTFLPAPFDRLGVMVNYTRIQSALDYVLAPTTPDQTYRAPLVGTSPTAINATVYYQTPRYAVRLSAARRGEYTRTVPSRGGVCGPEATAECPTPYIADVDGADATFNLDASASLNLTGRLQLTLDMLNLTDQAQSYWTGAARRGPLVYGRTGRQIFLGARWRY